MIEILWSDTFNRWLTKLKDRQAAARVLVRIRRLASDNPGDVRPVGHGVSELRLSYGPGYRIYYLRYQDQLILILAGGDKSSQQADITKAHEIAAQWRRTQGDPQ